MKIARALISVSDKTDILPFARALSQRGVEILSTGGTAALLREEGVPVIEVASWTGSPEILGGRVKTLHPKVHGGILGRRADPRHLDEMRANDIEPIDLVVVNLYPFEATVARDGCAFEDAVEQIDIGGPAMLRSAAKNHESVAVVADPADYSAIIAEMDAEGGQLTPAARRRLAEKAFALTARYDTAIADYLAGAAQGRGSSTFPARVRFAFEKIQELRYGENPHQRAAFYRDERLPAEPSLVGALQRQGKELSYNNIMDADAALEAVQDFCLAPFAAVIVKHANPCGAALSELSLADAFAKAFACDPLSAFGGIVAVNRVVGEAAARAISESFFEVIAAPGFDPAALDLFAKKKNLRLLEVSLLGRSAPLGGFNLRKVAGGLLLQERDASREEVRTSKVATSRPPTEEEWRAMGFAWRICRQVKSNAVVYTSADRTLGIGGGQASRVDASRIAAMKLKEFEGRGFRSKTIAVASDAFFPFRDGIDAAAKAGATAVIQPGGSLRDGEAIAAAEEHGMAMVLTGVRHFRH